MKDEADTKTEEAFGRGPGRPRQYASAAERQKAYRQRLKQRGMEEKKRVQRAPVAEGEPLESEVLDLTTSVGQALRERKG